MSLDYSQPGPLPKRHGSAMHRLALLTAAATFPLIFMGGLVTTHGAGMSVPDWPNSFGYNMFLFPPNRWVGGIFYEHTHRLMGTVVGLLSILLTLVAWWTDSRPRIRWLAACVLGMVILQGVLGGLRVVLVKLNLAIVHACVAQAFFCLACYFALVTSSWWTHAPDQSADPRGRRLVMLGVTTVALIYLQLIAGAVMRHDRAGLAVTDFPLIYGHALPPLHATQLRTINAHRAWSTLSDSDGRDASVIQQLSEPVTLAQVWIHALHRYGAVLVTLAVLAFSLLAIKHRKVGGLFWPAIGLMVLVSLQVTLGSLVVLLRKPADLTSLHVAVGALTLATAFVLTSRAWRVYGSPLRFSSAAWRGSFGDRAFALDH